MGGRDDALSPLRHSPLTTQQACGNSSGSWIPGGVQGGSESICTSAMGVASSPPRGERIMALSYWLQWCAWCDAGAAECWGMAMPMRGKQPDWCCRCMLRWRCRACLRPATTLTCARPVVKGDMGSAECARTQGCERIDSTVGRRAGFTSSMDSTRSLAAEDKTRPKCSKPVITSEARPWEDRGQDECEMMMMTSCGWGGRRGMF
jgi:hypothetical protein